MDEGAHGMKETSVTGIDVDLHILTPEEVNAEIAKYEQIIGMSSRKYLKCRARGIAPDTFEANLLGALLRNRGKKQV